MRLHPQHAHQRPKIEAYGHSLFVAVHTAQTVDDKIRFGETHAFLGPRYLVTVRHGASLSYAPVRARVEREPELLALGPAYAIWTGIGSVGVVLMGVLWFGEALSAARLGCIVLVIAGSVGLRLTEA